MAEAKGWDWEKASQAPWLDPCEDSYYLAHKWLGKGYQDVLDLGAGLGRHSILFAKLGLSVSALDISEYAIGHLKGWAEREGQTIDIRVGDMTALPYADHSIDCIFAYHVISHTDTNGFLKVVGEMERVLRPGGEVYFSLCSKDSWEFENAGYPVLDRNTVIRNEEGPENNIAHFYANLDDILGMFSHFEIEKIRHVDYCYANGQKQNGKYYYVNAKKR